MVKADGSVSAAIEGMPGGRSVGVVEGIAVGVADEVGLASAPFATTVPPICGWIPGSETVPSHDAAPLLVAG